ncbi:hypothetical protein CCP4SC76_7730018 [Gammaproteobacteria bacterium]
MPHPPPASYADKSPEVQMVHQIMPSVVGIGVDRRGGLPFGFSKSNILSLLQEQYQQETQKLKEHSPKSGTQGVSLPKVEDLQVIGSGFITQVEGQVATAYHVVEGQRRVYVLTHDNRIFAAEVVQQSRQDDLALLRMESGKEKFSVFTLGDSSALDIAETVYAIGNPFGFTFSVTKGIVSAVNRDVGQISDLIQTDAPVNPGNSGGPLVNARGEVVGINHAIVSQRQQAGFVGLSFAVPVNRLKTLLAGGGASGR